MHDDAATPAHVRLAVLCRLFAEVLELDHVTPDTDFFLAGGHSLSAVALALAVEGTCGTPMKVRDLFDCATPKLLADRIASSHGPDTPRPADADRAPQSAMRGAKPPGQAVGEATRWLWLERQRGGGTSAAYTVPCLLSGQGPLDVDRLRTAVTALRRRHPMLRAVFTESYGEPRAVVTEQAEPLRVVDLREQDAGEASFAALVDEQVHTVFGPLTGPLFQATLFLRPGGAWSVLFIADHLVCDGRGLDIVAADCVKAYHGEALGAPRAAGPAARSHARSREDALAYWRRRLSPPPAPLPLPVTRPRSALTGTAMANVVRDIDPGWVDRLRTVARDSHAGLFAPLAAGVAQALAELTGSSDICLGTPVDRRSQLGLRGEIGFHVATVPLRVAVPEGGGGQQLVRDVAALTMDAVDHSAVSFDAVVAALDPPRPAWRTPFFDAWVALYPHIDTGVAGPDGIRLRGGPVPLRHGMFELSFQFAEHETGLRLVLQYDTHRYDTETVSRIADLVVANVGRLADDPETPERGENRPSPLPATEPVFGGFRFPSR